ncbi:MAG: serine/threonine-protein kinase, partial [Acidobacteriota bacterium]
MDDALNAEQWSRIKEILDEVADVPPGARRAAVESACGGDRELFEQVHEYLELDDRAETFIGSPLWRVMPGADDPAPGPTQRVGPYRLERLIGQGGMGEVYLATRKDDYTQKVAIKRTLAPVLRAELEKRFVNERQILANLQHPGIARLLDGGTDDRGFPYLVMEYVDGVPIDIYCRRHGITLRQRLRLVSKVCRIVHYAHQNLVVHRDLKPSNILVTEHGQPRLLDFGIAKLLHTDAAATAREKAVLTPACASPEQIMGEPVTTACDVYALGVLLYRLLAGKAPYELHGLPFPAVRRIVCLQRTDKPSQAAATIGARRSQHPDSVVVGEERPAEEEAAEAPAENVGRRRAAQLRGDLDAIVMKAMRKEPEHRFGSAAELADDIDRYLAGLPVEARRGSWFYQAGKHLRRNKPIVALMALILALAVISTILGVRAESARRETVEALERAEALTGLVTEILLTPAPDAAKGRDLTVREVVEQASSRIDSTLAGQPGLRAKLSTILGEVLSKLGDTNQALTLFENALDATVESGAPPCDSTADAIGNIASVHYQDRRFELAERGFQEALDLRRRCGDPPLTIAWTLANLTNARKQLGQIDGIAEAYQRVLELRTLHGGDGEVIAHSHYSLGAWRLRTEGYASAIPHLEEALRRFRRTEIEPSTHVASVAKTLARAYHDARRLDEARTLYEKSLADHIVLYGDEDLRVTRLKPHVARALLDLGDVDGASALARDAFERVEALTAPDPKTVAAVGSVWGACLAR